MLREAHPNTYYSVILQSTQVKCTPPQDYINEFIIQKLNPVGSCRFQIHVCSLACVMSHEFTRDSGTKFLPAKFP